jgi:hypothetical protein
MSFGVLSLLGAGKLFLQPKRVRHRKIALRSLGRGYDLTLKPGSEGVMRWSIDFRD